MPRGRSITIIEDGLSADQRATHDRMNALIRGGGARGSIEAPVFTDSPRQRAEQAASRRISDSLRAAAGRGTVVRQDTPDPDRERRLAGAAESSHMNRLIREAAGRGTTTSPDAPSSPQEAPDAHE